MSGSMSEMTPMSCLYVFASSVEKLGCSDSGDMSSELERAAKTRLSRGCVTVLKADVFRLAVK